MFHDGFVTLEQFKLPIVILPLDGGGLRWGWTCLFPLTLALSPAFAEAASRRQAPGERVITGLFSMQLNKARSKNWVI